jgi:hypothetical protein
LRRFEGAAAGALPPHTRVGFNLPLNTICGVGELQLLEEKEEFIYVFSDKFAYPPVILT